MAHGGFAAPRVGSATCAGSDSRWLGTMRRCLRIALATRTFLSWKRLYAITSPSQLK